MDRNIKVTVEDRVATAEGDPSFICGNSTYTVTFTFDDEWEDFEVKTALFKWLTADGMKKHEQPFTGDTVEAPVFFDTREVEVGVYAGDLTTTTGAPVRCKPSVRCNAGEDVEPEPDKYNLLMELIKGGELKGQSAYEAAKAGGYEGTEEEFQRALADIASGNGGAIAERPTDTLELVSNEGFGQAGVPGSGCFIIHDEWSQLTDEDIADGTEIKKIEIQLPGATDWVDLKELHTIDSAVYHIAMSRVYRDELDRKVFAIAAYLYYAESLVYQLVAAGEPVRIRVTYYTD